MEKICYNNLHEAIELLIKEKANLKSMFYSLIQDPKHKIYNRIGRIKVASNVLVYCQSKLYNLIMMMKSRIHMKDLSG
ncbi:MAG: hypothetical protein ACOYO1_00830 [Bacteroidales bacterium]